MACAIFDRALVLRVILGVVDAFGLVLLVAECRFGVLVESQAEFETAEGC